MIGVYAIFRKSDNKCMYVGQSKDINGRIKGHLDGKTHLSFNKEEYYSKILETHDIDDKTYRLNREAFFIKELNPELNKIRDKHFHHSEETKKKIGEANKGENSAMYGKPAWNRGISPSEESKEKNRQAHLGENNSCYGTHFKWMNNGVTNKRVKPDELQQYLGNGWILGMKKTKK